jgi:hypothetical protein
VVRCPCFRALGVLLVRATTCACGRTLRDQPNRSGSCGVARRRVDAARQTCSRRSRERARSRGATSAPVHRVSLRAACLRIDRLRVRLSARLRSSARANDTHRGGVVAVLARHDFDHIFVEVPVVELVLIEVILIEISWGALRVPTESKLSELSFSVRRRRMSVTSSCGPGT